MVKIEPLRPLPVARFRHEAKTVLAGRERDADGHLLPVHPQDRRKGPR
jgi:hypothetical protein